MLAFNENLESLYNSWKVHKSKQKYIFVSRQISFLWSDKIASK